MLLKNPRNFLPIDAAGAFLTAIVTAFLLATQVLDTGLPRSVLYIMAAVAALYGVFGIAGFSLKLKTETMLRTLAALNLFYGVATIVICAINRDQVTTIGFIYFSVETAILFALAAFEWSLAHRTSD